LVQSDGGLMAAWEIGQQVYLGKPAVGEGKASEALPAPGSGRRKHPRLASNSKGETLLVWAEGTGWNKGGAVGWQEITANGKSSAGKGRKEGLPVWSFPAVFATVAGDFTILY
jgi:hypothetical protein